MDVGEYLEMYSEYEYGDVKRGDKKEVSNPSITYDDGQSSQVPKAGAGRGKKGKKATQGENNPEKVYEIPNVYAEIPDADYETLQQGTIELPMSATPQSSVGSTRPALPGEPQHQPCCGKSAHFWCLLSVAISTVTVILLASLLTGINSNDLKYKPYQNYVLSRGCYTTHNSSSMIEYLQPFHYTHMKLL